MKFHYIFPAGIALAFVAGICLLAPKCCTRPVSARTLLNQHGYTNVTITGWRPFMAGKDDSVSTGFEATAPNGMQVSGAVTSGFILKGATIRFD